MREALRQIEALGLEQEPAACELYNSIAQLMVVKHRAWNTSKKERANKEALRYVNMSICQYVNMLGLYLNV